MGSVDYLVTGQWQLVSLTAEKEKQDLSALVERLLNSTWRTHEVWEMLRWTETIFIMTLKMERNTHYQDSICLGGSHHGHASPRGHPVRSGHVSGGGLLWYLRGRAQGRWQTSHSESQMATVPRLRVLVWGEGLDSPQVGFNDLNLSLFIKIKLVHWAEHK